MSDDDEENEKDLTKNIKELLASLTPREAKVLRERFGVELKDNAEFEDIGNQFDITRERIREIERKALAKLRNQHGQKISSTTPKRCSFCESTLEQSDKYVEGKSSVFICRNCLDLCSKILDEDDPDKS